MCVCIFYQEPCHLTNIEIAVTLQKFKAVCIVQAFSVSGFVVALSIPQQPEYCCCTVAGEYASKHKDVAELLLHWGVQAELLLADEAR